MHRLAAFAVLALLATALGAPAAAADVSLAHGRGALASFSGPDPSDPSGCVNTLAVAFGGLSDTHDPPEPRSTTPELLVFVYSFDACRGETVFFGLVRGPAPEAEVAVDQQLDAARLRATTTLVDQVSGAAVPVAVDLAWSGVGRVERGHTTERLQFDRCLLVTESTVASRAATVGGSLVVGGTELATGPAAEASFHAGRSSRVAVNCA
jgi:hypothetical protein